MTYIFLHGLGQTSSSWDETVKSLDKELKLFTPNLSYWIKDKESSFNTLYDELIKYCEKVDDDLCLVGLSLGGVLALKYAIEHQDKVKSLVLIGTQYKMPKGLLKFQNVIFHLMPKSVFSKMGFQKSDFINLCKSMMDLDFSSSIKHIKAKTLVIYGKKDKANKSAAIELSKLIPNAELVCIPNSNHEVNNDKPDLLAKEINRFCK